MERTSVEHVRYWREECLVKSVQCMDIDGRGIALCSVWSRAYIHLRRDVHGRQVHGRQACGREVCGREGRNLEVRAFTQLRFHITQNCVRGGGYRRRRGVCVFFFLQKDRYLILHIKKPTIQNAKTKWQWPCLGVSHHSYVRTRPDQSVGTEYI